MIEILTLNALTDNFIYVLTDGTSAAVIDPGECAPVAELLDRRKLELKHILLTHHHGDHVDGAAELARRGDVEVVCSRGDVTRIPNVTRGLDDGDIITVLGSPVEVIATPGHTRGHVAYRFARQDAVFTGDTLFSGGCGRLFEGTPAEMFASLRRLATLPDATRIYFGHEYTLNNLAFIKSRLPADARDEVDAYHTICRVARAADQPTSPTTLAVEKRVNPFVRAADVPEFTAWREARNHW